MGYLEALCVIMLHKVQSTWAVHQHLMLCSQNKELVEWVLKMADTDSARPGGRFVQL